LLFPFNYLPIQPLISSYFNCLKTYSGLNLEKNGKNMAFKLKRIVILFFLLFVIRCDAPRNNPLDINNPRRELGLIEGRVLTQSLPYKPLPMTNIRFTGDGRWTQCNEQGKFKLDNIKRQPGWLFFEKLGYHRDSLYIDWQGSKAKVVEMHLNALPVVDSLLFYSSITNRYPNVQKLELFIKAWLWDQDNDVDSVFLVCPTLKAALNLRFNATEKFFERERISLNELNLELPDEIIGHSFVLRVKDLQGRQMDLAQTQVERIIREEVDLKSPAGNEVVSTMPTLRWQPLNLDYHFSYTVEVRTNEVDPQLVWFKKGLAPTTSSIEVDQPLPKTPINQYIWAVWVIDRFGNRARSKFKSFQVE